MAELGAISFEKPGLVDHLRDGSQPRKFSVLLPALDCDGAPVAHKVDPYDADSDMVRATVFLTNGMFSSHAEGKFCRC